MIIDRSTNVYGMMQLVLHIFEEVEVCVDDLGASDELEEARTFVYEIAGAAYREDSARKLRDRVPNTESNGKPVDSDGSKESE